jgi:hypothetical protein
MSTSRRIWLTVVSITTTMAAIYALAAPHIGTG